MANLAFVPKGLLNLLGKATNRWAEVHADHIYTYQSGSKVELTTSGGTTSSVDCRTFALMTGISPAKWYTPTAKTATSAVVEPSAATSGTMTIYVYSKVVGSSTTNKVATLSIPAVAAKIPTTVDFTDATIPANSQIWAECADLKSGGTVSVSVVMQ